jgi:serine/threonine-protein kinase
MSVGLVGTKLSGKYHVTSRIGAGGMGDVYLAQQEPIDRTVAIKVVAADKARSEEGRFLREAKLLSRLSHPNIVALFDYGHTDTGEPYLVMEHVDGGDLRARIIEDGPIDVAHAVEILRQATAAIAEAHRIGVAHLDLKPENIMLAVGPEGATRVKVLDFGISRLVEPEAMDHTATDTGAVLGTPAYISPEQIRGVRDDVRSDLYALGMVAYEMLSGQLPYEAATTAELVLHHMATMPTPLADKRPDVPAALAAWVHRLLAKSADDRPADGAEALRLLETAVTGHATEMSTGEIATGSLGSSSAIEPAVPLSARARVSPKKPTFTVYVGGLVSVVMVLGLAFFASWRASPPSSSVEPRRLVLLSFNEATDEVPKGIGEVISNAVGHALVGSSGATLVSPLLVRAAAHDLGMASFAQTANTRAPELLEKVDAQLVLTAEVVAENDKLTVDAILALVPELTPVASFSQTTSRSGPMLSSLSKALASQVRAHLDGTEEAPSTMFIPTTNVDAYQSFIRGMDQLDLEADYTAAADHFRRAVELDDEFAMAWSELSCALSFVDDASLQAEQAAAASRAESLKQRLPESTRLLLEGNVHWGRDEGDEALAKYDEYARRFPDDRTAHYYRGMAYWHFHQDAGTASAALLRARKLTPSYLPVTRELIKMANQDGTPKLALVWAKEFTVHSSGDARGWMLYASQLQKMNKLEEAREALRQALTRDEEVRGAAQLQALLKG